MDRHQFENWYDFADRMARQARPGLSGPTKSRLVRSVGKAVREAVGRHGLEAFEEWDAAPYPGDVFEEILVRDGLLQRGANGDLTGEIGMLAMCCIQSGFDLSVAPSAGVAGADFTVGLIHRMYPEGVPGFVSDHFEGVGLDIAAAPAEARVWL